MNLIRKVFVRLKELEKFSTYVIGFGVRVSIGLMAMSALFYFLCGKFGNYMTVFSYAKGAQDAAPAVLISAIAAGLLSDLVIKDRKQKT